MVYLSVCEDGGVVTLEAAVDQLLRAGGVDGVLLRVHVEHVVVGKGLVFAQDHLRLSRHHVGTDVTSLYLFSGQLRTNPKERKKTRYSRCINNSDELKNNKGVELFQLLVCRVPTF